MKSIVIAAPCSGSGKTTVTLGLMEALKRKGLSVAPFKVGPDFIDPGWHRTVTGRSSINLDGWMCPEQFVRETYDLHARDADIAVIEGVMGLHDGIDALSDAGSTAQVARIIGAPVLLVVDARSQARSVAALVQGFARFDRRVRVGGVIFNNVGSDNHARILRDATESAVPEVRVFGSVPRDENLRIPSRHLGLVTADESPLPDDFHDRLAAMVTEHVDLEGILSLQKGAEHAPSSPGRGGGVRAHIAVARDEAFCFMYEDNLRLLREAGAELVEFSPLRDACLPEGVSGIYLPGGYPELFADVLAGNTVMQQEIRGAIETGMPVYAECGGFIYLTRGLPSMDFAGIFPVTVRMLPKRKALGYREVALTADSILGPKGTTARGHEFHYSETEKMPDDVERVYQVSRKGNDLGLEGYRYRNCIASYIHLHFGSCPELAMSFVSNCTSFKERPLIDEP